MGERANLREGGGLFVPLFSRRGLSGVVGIVPDDARRSDDPNQFYFVEALIRQVAAALERSDLAEEAEQSRLLVQTEQLRNSLLSSVSHDLRTPLAVITGAASTLLGDDGKLGNVEKIHLLGSIFDEGERLNRLIRNLLDMKRLQSGAVKVDKEWYTIEEIIGSSLNRTEQRLASRTVKVTVSPDLGTQLDPVLIEQALVNLLENAGKYTEPGTVIDIRADRVGGDVIIEVADRGPGIAAGDEDRIFDKFYRGAHGGAPGGAGLGLTIARGIAVAHGGRLWAENRPGGGASFKLALPAIEPDPRWEPVETLEGTRT
jgi:two-component system sensor histidine kinase KdpD